MRTSQEHSDQTVTTERSGQHRRRGIRTGTAVLAFTMLAGCGGGGGDGGQAHISTPGTVLAFEGATRYPNVVLQTGITERDRWDDVDLSQILSIIQEAYESGDKSVLNFAVSDRAPEGTVEFLLEHVNTALTDVKLTAPAVRARPESVDVQGDLTQAEYVEFAILTKDDAGNSQNSIGLVLAREDNVPNPTSTGQVVTAYRVIGVAPFGDNPWAGIED